MTLQLTEHKLVLLSQIRLCVTPLCAAPVTASGTPSCSALSKMMHCSGLYLYLSSKVLNYKNPS